MHLAAPLRHRLSLGTVPRPPRRTLRLAAILGLVALVLAAGFAWLRDSSVVRVRDVYVTGVGSGQEAQVRAALQRAALGMTTLHVREDELRAAVAPYASVARLDVDARLPRTLKVEVVERVPAAVVVAAGQRVPVSSGGLLLRGLRSDAGLPVVTMPSLPAGPRVDDRRARAAIAVLAGAPAPLRARVERARFGAKGLALDLRDGPALIFGTDSRVAAKWQAATRVLADSSAQGAVYLDLRLPEWTAAGGVGPVKPEPTVAPETAEPTEPQPQP